MDVVDRDGDRAFPVAAGGRWHRGALFATGAGTWGALGSELSYRDEISQLQARWPGRVHYVPCVTREPWREGIAGRIPAAIAQGALEASVGLPFSADASRFVLCGNPQMVKETLQALQLRGFRKHLRREAGEICMENYW